MEYKYQYTSDTDRAALITAHSDKFLVEDQSLFADATCTTKNNYLVFSDTQPTIREISMPVQNSDLVNLNNTVNMVLLKQEGII